MKQTVPSGGEEQNKALDYLERLNDAIREYGAYTEQTLIPPLREDIQVFVSSVKGLFAILRRRDFIKESRYSYGEPLALLECPPKDLSVQTDDSILATRLEAYQEQLDFLANNFLMTSNSFDAVTLKKVLGLLSYIEWDDFSIDSRDPMIGVFVRFEGDLLIGGASADADMFRSYVSVLQEKQKNIRDHLNKLVPYGRALYKMMIRNEILPHIVLEPQRVRSDQLGTIQAIRFEFELRRRDDPFYKPLINEILEEDYSLTKEEVRERTLESLRVPQKLDTVIQPRDEDPHIVLAREIIRVLLKIGKIYIPLNSIIDHFSNNSAIERKFIQSLWERLLILVYRLLRRERPIIYEIYINRPGEGLIPKSVDFPVYIQNLRNQSNIYWSLSNGESSKGVALKAMPLKELEELLRFHASRGKRLLDNLEAMENFFKKGVSYRVRRMTKSCETEISQIRDTVAYTLRGYSNYKMLKAQIYPN